MRINLSPLIKCDSCNMRFKDKSGYENHLSQSKKCKRSEEFVCRIKSCKKSFSSLFALNKHYECDHTFDEIVEKLFGGIRPLCKCGCGQITDRSRDDKIFNGYIFGHCTWANTLSDEQRKLGNENATKTWKSMTLEERREKCALYPP